jgi:hypothetical protein
MQYPPWLVSIVGLIVFVMGAVVIYAAVTFISLNPCVTEWSALARAGFLLLAYVWGKHVWGWAADVDAQQ